MSPGGRVTASVALAGVRGFKGLPPHRVLTQDTHFMFYLVFSR